MSCVHIAAAEYQRVIVSVVLEVVSTLSCWCHCECLNRSSCKASLPPPRVIQTIPDISHADYLASGQSVSDYIRQVIDSFRSKTVVAGYRSQNGGLWPWPGGAGRGDAQLCQQPRHPPGQPQDGLGLSLRQGPGPRARLQGGQKTFWSQVRQNF